MLRKTFGLKREDVTGYWNKLQNKKLKKLCVLSNNIRLIKWKMMRRSQHVTFVEKKKNAYRVLMWKTEVKRQVGSLQRLWLDNIT